MKKGQRRLPLVARVVIEGKGVQKGREGQSIMVTSSDAGVIGVIARGNETTGSGFVTMCEVSRVCLGLDGQFDQGTGFPCQAVEVRKFVGPFDAKVARDRVGMTCQGTESGVAGCRLAAIFGLKK